MFDVGPRLARACLGFVLLALAPAAFALNVAVYGSSNYVTAIQGGGNTATQITESQIEAGILSYDVLMMGHSTDLTPAACTAIKAFLNAGKGVVTEWSDAYDVFTATGPNVTGVSGTQCALFTGTVDYGGYVGTNTPLTITNTASPLVAGLPNPLALQGGSEYFFTISGFDTGVWSVVATFDGNTTTNNPAIMTATYNGAGRVVVGAFDYGDELGVLANDNTMVNDFVAFAATGSAPPPPPPVVTVPVPALGAAALAALALMLAVAGFAAQRHRSRRA